MTALPGTTGLPRGAERDSAALHARAWLAAGALVVATALLLRAGLRTDADTSWLLHAAGRWVDGARLYRDVLEVNPPASVLIYVPAVLLARLVSASPETVTNALLFFATVASLWLSASVLLRADLLQAARVPQRACVALAVLLVLPISRFAQREHVALLALLPILACFAARAAGHRPTRFAALLAGIGAGVAIAIKPVFGLALVGPGLFVFAAQPWRTGLMAIEAWVACVVVSAYGIAVGVLMPDFAARVMPLLIDVYLPARLPLPVLILLRPVCWIWAGLLLTYGMLRPRRDIVGTVLAFASVGLLAGFLIQGKGFAYHGYPAIAAAALACEFGLLDTARRGGAAAFGRLLPACVATGAALYAFTSQANVARFAPGLTEAIAAIAPAPRLLTIGSDMPMGQLYTREIGGTWVGTAPIAWITTFASYIATDPETDPRFAADVAIERDLYAADILRNEPAVVLIEGDAWLAWANRAPALAGALATYRQVGRFGGVLLFARTPDTVALRPSLPVASPSLPPGAAP